MKVQLHNKKCFVCAELINEKGLMFKGKNDWVNNPNGNDIQEICLHYYCAVGLAHRLKNILENFDFLKENIIRRPKCVEKEYIIQNKHKCIDCGETLTNHNISQEHIIPRCVTDNNYYLYNCRNCNQNYGNLFGLFIEPNTKLDTCEKYYKFYSLFLNNKADKILLLQELSTLIMSKKHIDNIFDVNLYQNLTYE